MEPQVKRVPLKDLIVTDIFRAQIDPKKIEELAESMKKQGQLQPVLARPLKTGGLELVAGQRRLLAARKLGWTDIEAKVAEMTDDQVVAARIMENVRRVDFNEIEKAKAVKRFLDLRRSQKADVRDGDVAAELGFSAPEFSNTLLLLKMPLGVQDVLARGGISPGHVEHVLAPLREKVSEKALVEFALKLEERRTDIRTAKRETEWVVKRAQEAAAKEKANKAAQGAKVRKCPVCTPKKIKAKVARAYEIGGRVILECNMGYEYDTSGGHKWDAETGEEYLSPSEKKWRQDQEAARQRQRRQGAKKGARAREVHVVRECAVLLSRAAIQWWAGAFLDEARGAGIDEIDWYGAYFNTHHHKVRGLEDVDEGLHLNAISLTDGNGGHFLTRVQIGFYKSGLTFQDNVAEGPAAVGHVRKIRAALLAYQRKKLVVAQPDGDLWPKKCLATAHLAVGDKVRITAKTEWKSYVGKQGTIVAFDLAAETYGHPGEGGGEGEVSVGRDVLAVLSIGAAHKVHPVGTLESVATSKEERPPKVPPIPKGSRAAKQVHKLHGGK